MAWQDSDTTGGKIRLKHSQVAAETIGPSGLVPGEIALNAADGKLFFRSPGGTTGSVSGMDEPPSDSITYGRRNETWVDVTSPANLQVRRGTAAEVAGTVLLPGEPAWATDTKMLFVGDGATSGGIPSGKFPMDGVAGNGTDGGSARISPAVLHQNAITPDSLGAGAVDLQTSRTSSSQVASGQYSFTAGRANTASAEGAFATGRGITASMPFEMSHGVRRLIFGSTFFDVRNVQYILSVSTSSASATAMNNVNGGVAIPVPSGYYLCGTLSVFGSVISTGSDHAYMERRIVASNKAGTTTVPTATTIGTDVKTNAAWDLAVSADDTNDRVKIDVTGAASTDVSWVAVFEGILTQILGA